MIKKILFSLVLSSTILLLPGEALAQEVQTCTQVTQYGGAVSYICGASTHIPVNTGIGGFEPMEIGGVLMLTSGTFLYISRRLRGKKF